jgi:hypothetical protein
MLMKNRSLIWGILGCALLVFGFTQCDMGSSPTNSALTVCDAGADATCTAPPDPAPTGGW